MKLVIAEKPSVAQSIAAVLGANEKGDGFLAGNGWCVSWCVGHIAGLADADHYDPKYAHWTQEDLPIIPQNWSYVVDGRKEKRFSTLLSLLHDPETEEIINACDAGREGELIFRTVYALANCRKPVKRLWISSLEDSAIRDGFAHLRPGAEYDNLYAAALCRSKADWLVGINATRLFSVLYHRTLNIGRVMSPTLAMIVQRESEIAAFQSTPFYTVELNSPQFTAVTERLQNKADAEVTATHCAGAAATVEKLSCKEKTERPPALYDLTALQRDANRLLGYTAQQTLDYLQALYEKKLCTYPRTDSRYLTEDMAAGLPALVHKAGAIWGEEQEILCDEAQVICGQKVSDHHAILPTGSIGETTLDALPVGERAVLELIGRRLLCAVAQPHVYKETRAELQCGGATFSAQGQRDLIPGWTALCKDLTKAPPPLPDLQEGQLLTVTGAAVKEGHTTPPRHFTEDTLLCAMENAGAETMPEQAERRGLGTPATRAGILEKLVSTGFVRRKRALKVVYLLPSAEAVSLITVLPEALQSPLLTADWEYRLGEIEQGNLLPDLFMQEIADMVSQLVTTYHLIPGTECLFAPDNEVIGKCPRCGAEVTEQRKGFFCQNPACKFAIWKNSKWWSAKQQRPTKEIVAQLLAQGKAPVQGLYSEKTGKFYNATVVLQDTDTYVNFALEFPERK